MSTSVPPRSVLDHGSQHHRGWASILAVGAVFMFGRAVQLVWQGSLSVFVPWAGGLLVLELLVNAVTLFATLWWAIVPDSRRMRIALRAVAGTVVAHAVRVLVFVLGRTGPWVDFDILPERRADHAAGWSWAGVWFAAVMASTSVVVLILLWAAARRRR